MTASVRYSRVASASAAPVTDYRTAKVDGVNVFYREAGPADAPVVLLLHGVHRIIGRSTTYGAPYDPNALSEEDDDVPRGVYFLFISAKAMATLEFLQQEWINDGDFTALGEERNPVVGLQPDDALFSISAGAGSASRSRSGVGWDPDVLHRHLDDDRPRLRRDPGHEVLPLLKQFFHRRIAHCGCHPVVG
jgi:hypothetical protein